jgi:hypothetical protein
MTAQRMSGKSREQARRPKLQQQAPFLEHGKYATKMSLLSVRGLTSQAEVVAHRLLGLEVGQHLLDDAV